MNLRETHTPQTVIRLEPADREAAPDTHLHAYGLAWGLKDYRGRLVISHAGAIDGFRANITLVPEAKLGIAVLANLGGSPSLPEAASSALVDLVLGPLARDWNALLFGVVSKREAADKKRREEREVKRQKGTSPSRELTAYAGDYENAAYGTATVSAAGDALAVRWSNFASKLEHYHYDTFTAKERFAIDPVTFRLGPDGEVAGMRFLAVEFTKAKTAARGSATSSNGAP